LIPAFICVIDRRPAAKVQGALMSPSLLLI